jgi:hypothetical protein
MFKKYYNFGIDEQLLLHLIWGKLKLKNVVKMGCRDSSFTRQTRKVTRIAKW